MCLASCGSPGPARQVRFSIPPFLSVLPRSATHTWRGGELVLPLAEKQRPAPGSRPGMKHTGSLLKETEEPKRRTLV